MTANSTSCASPWKAFLSRIPKATNDAVVKDYERRIEELSVEEQIVKENLNKAPVKKISFETATEKVFDFLSNPHQEWVNGNIHRKRLLLKIVFTEKIAYIKEIGFETANLSIPLRAFGHFVTSKTRGVEMGGLRVNSRRTGE